MRKFINVLSHPSYIVLYFKDKIYHAILYVLFFFIATASLLALYDFTNKHFTREYPKALITEIVNYDKEVIDLEFKDNKLEGTSVKFQRSGICAYFLPKTYVYSESVVLIFKETELMVVYDAIQEYHISYEKLDVPDLKLSDVQKSDILSKLAFESVVYEALSYAENDAKTMDFMLDVAHLFIFFVFAMAIILVSSFFVNPAIEFKYRINICLYDSIIFFVVMIISLLFNIVWLEYVALFLAAFYARCSFRSIVRVR